jgi:hypothetical protein
MDMSIPSTNKKDTQHTLPGSSFSLFAISKTDVSGGKQVKGNKPGIPRKI